MTFEVLETRTVDPTREEARKARKEEKQRRRMEEKARFEERQAALRKMTMEQQGGH